jgi:hypothetical protein
MARKWMNDELEWIWKEAVVAQSWYYSVICMKALRKSRINRRIAEIWTKHQTRTARAAFPIRFSLPLLFSYSTFLSFPALLHVFILPISFMFYKLEFYCCHYQVSIATNCWTQWPRDLRFEISSPPQKLGSWVRIPLKAWMFFCVYSVCIGSDLATGWSPVQGVLLTVLRLRNWSGTMRFADSVCSKVEATGRRERATVKLRERKLRNRSRAGSLLFM